METLIDSGVCVNLVCGLDENYSKNVSDYYPIHKIAVENNIPFVKFRKVDDMETWKAIQLVNPDFIFVIGLSQIIPKSILNLANEYAIGFHPTPCPNLEEEPQYHGKYC